MLSLTWYGNATVKIMSDDSEIVFDPFITLNSKLPQLQVSDIAGVSSILVTHGHFDHVADIPFFSNKLNAKTYLPAEVYENLKENPGIRKDTFLTPSLLEPIQIGDLKATMYRTRHIQFDKPLVIKTLLRSFFSPIKFRQISKQNTPMGRCVGWLIEQGGFRLFHIGSLTLHPEESYPKGMDVLSLPLQGHTLINDMAVEVIEKLSPKRVFIQHFDDGFPPISQQIPTEPFVELMNQKHPEIDVIVPDYGKPIEVL
ncbi:MBL fold metallo-hydrolase [Thermodesulfobacteriota bacterium]